MSGYCTRWRSNPRSKPKSLATECDPDGCETANVTFIDLRIYIYMIVLDLYRDYDNQYNGMK